MTTICPICGKSIDRRKIEAHMSEHEWVDEMEKAISREK